MHTRENCIAIKYYFQRELVHKKEVRLDYVNTKEQIKGIFTKLLPMDAFLYTRGEIGVIPLSETD